jgi:hypothetical protein
MTDAPQELTVEEIDAFERHVEFIIEPKYLWSLRRVCAAARCAVPLGCPFPPSPSLPRGEVMTDAPPEMSEEEVEGLREYVALKDGWATPGVYCFQTHMGKLVERVSELEALLTKTREYTDTYCISHDGEDGLEAFVDLQAIDAALCTSEGK